MNHIEPEFNFGGRDGEDIKNANPRNIDRTIDLVFGADKPTIKPIKWTESGTPRFMYFFVPYPDMTQLKAGVHDLNVTLKTVTGTTFEYPLTFSLGCAGPPIKVGNLEVQACDYIGSTGQALFSWAEAVSVAQTYGPGWHLPTKEELNQVYQNRDVVRVPYRPYWSSTEDGTDDAWFQQMAPGLVIQRTMMKDYPHLRVRAVRAF